MTDFAIGQRYLSDTENELGLGVVVLVDERCVHILFPQSEETRVYAKTSAPLSRVTFQSQGIPYMTKMAHRVVSDFENQWRHKYSVEGHDRAIMETRLAANINLAKPLNACSPVVFTKMIGTNCAKSYCVPKPIWRLIH